MEVSRCDAAEWGRLLEGREHPPGADPELTSALGAALRDARAGAALVGGPRGRLLVPFVLHRGRLGTIADALPFGIPSGPVVLEGEPFTFDPRRLRAELGASLLRLQVHHSISWDGRARRGETHLLDLQGDPAAEYRTRARRYVRRAEGAGVTVREAGAGDEDVVVELLERSAATAGRAAQDEQVVRGVLRSGRAFALVADVDGSPASVALFLESASEVLYWLGGTLPEAEEQRPSFLVMDAAIRRAAESGRRTFNFGASEGLAGVAYFKEGFGGRRAAYARVESKSPLVALGDLVLRALERR